MTSPLSTRTQKGQRRPGRDEHAGLAGSERSWSRSLDLSIAGMSVHLAGLSSGVRQAVLARFGLFVAPPPQGVPYVRIQVMPAPVPGYLDFDAQKGPPLYRLETRVNQGRLHAWSYAFAGWYDLERGEGEVNLCDSSVEPSDRSVENFLRVVLAWKAVQLGGFLLHASGLVRRGRAHLFFGPSGSGKTTVTRLSPSDLLLNDDCILVRREAGRFVASGLPFKGSDDGGARNTESFPIAGLFRLVQSSRVACQPMSGVHAVTEIAGSVPFVSERPEGLQALLDTLEEFVREVPVKRLHFRLAPDFWDAVEEAVRG